MSHPESDGVAELLEGGHRAVLTGVQRWLEMLNREQADRAAVAARISQRSAEHDRKHRWAVEAFLSKVKANRGPMGDSAIRAAVWYTCTPAEWDRARLMEALTEDLLEEWDIDDFVDTRTRILCDWKVDQAHHAAEVTARPDVFDDRYHRAWAVMEATDAQLDVVEERAAAGLAQAPASADGGSAAFRSRLLDQLADVVAADARAAIY